MVLFVTSDDILLCTILLRNLGPGVSQGDDAVEYEFVLRGINRVHTEISKPLELKAAARTSLS